MKKGIALVTALFIMLLTACAPVANENGKDYTHTNYDEMRAVWLSYYDYDFNDDNEETAKAKIESIFKNIYDLKLNTVFVHVRANADAIYKSELFPYSDTVYTLMERAPDFDILKHMIDCAHKYDLKIHAWINPFRVSNTHMDPELLPDGHIAKEWYKNGNTDYKVIPYNEKIYFNPSVTEVRRLIIDGVREIIASYDIDGIHFDDYFYPVCDESFDAESYKAYCESAATPLSLYEWRTANISTLVSAVKKITEENGLLFGISPSAHIDDDYLSKNGYADIKTWLQSDGYVDYIIPQIYWGFQYPNEEYAFDNMLKKWCSLARKGPKLYVGLAAYKAGAIDLNSEWQENTDILKRQILSLRKSGVLGFSLFSYSYLFGQDEHLAKERTNIKSVLN